MSAANHVEVLNQKAFEINKQIHYAYVHHLDDELRRLKKMRLFLLDKQARLGGQ